VQSQDLVQNAPSVPHWITAQRLGPARYERAVRRMLPCAVALLGLSVLFCLIP
jgi:hypothetical protein